MPALSKEEITQAIHDNLKNLKVDVLDVVNLRGMFHPHHAHEGSIEAPLTVLAELKHQGLIRHLGLSNTTRAQIEEGRKLSEIVCVQNNYNVINRGDDAIIDLFAKDGIAYVPFFPLGGFSPIQSSALSSIAQILEATPMQVALAWLLKRSPNILLIPGTGSVAHLTENLQAADLVLSPEAIEGLEKLN